MDTCLCYALLYNNQAILSLIPFFWSFHLFSFLLYRLISFSYRLIFFLSLFIFSIKLDINKLHLLRPALWIESSFSGARAKTAKPPVCPHHETPPKLRPAHISLFCMHAAGKTSLCTRNIAGVSFLPAGTKS